jgi:hypothetical protein
LDQDLLGAGEGRSLVCGAFQVFGHPPQNPQQGVGKVFLDGG